MYLKKKCIFFISISSISEHASHFVKKPYSKKKINNLKHNFKIYSFFLININMGYSYWDSFEKNSQSISLHNALQKPNCASTNHLEHIIDNGRFRHLPCEQNTLQWVNNNNEIISIAFPAILDLDGSLSCIPPTFVSSFHIFPFSKNKIK